jgi:hypothetical protein
MKEAPLLTTKQVAERAGVKPQVMQKHRGRGTGPPVVYLSKTCARYRPEAVEAWLVSRTATSTADAKARGLAPSGRGARGVKAGRL